MILLDECKEGSRQGYIELKGEVALFFSVRDGIIDQICSFFSLVSLSSFNINIHTHNHTHSLSFS